MKTRLPMLLTITTFALAACSGNVSAPAPSTDGTLAPVPAEYADKSNPLGADAAKAGASVFSTNCAMCHGEQGHGDGPAGTSLVPPPKNLAELSKTATDDYLFWRISTGKPGTGMFGWKGVLADDEIWEVVAYIRTLK